MPLSSLSSAAYDLLWLASQTHMARDRAPLLAPPEVGHVCRQDRQRGHADVEGQPGHREDEVGHVRRVEGRLGTHGAVGLARTCAMPAVMSVVALPMSIWPQTMWWGRPSSASDLVSPVTACLLAA